MKKFFRSLVPLLLAALIIASIGWYLFVYDRDFTRDMLLQQARYHDTSGNPKLASWFYDLAYKHSGRDENIAIELANQYKADGNYTKAEYTLSNAIRDGGNAELYVALCRTYVEQDKLLDAVNMLNNISDPTIKAELEALRPSAPTADPTPGMYSQYIDVNITSSAPYLFCTTDGEYPSTGDTPYAAPISLGAGETIIYAVAVNEQGLVSPLSVLGYTIVGVIEPVEFTDTAIELTLREMLQIPADETVYTNNLWDVTDFTVPEDAQSIEDLKYLPYLQKLTIHAHKLESLAPISTLSKLQTLDLTGCQFAPEELASLAALPQLTRLILAETGLSTIADLSGCKTLTSLDLTHNTLRNLEPLASMTTLSELLLGHNAITGLESLSGLSNLEILDVSYNSLTSLAPLESCTKLTWLDASNNSLAALEALDSLSLLTHLSVAYNQLAEIDLLGSCTNLTELDVSNNQLISIYSLGSLSKLEVLDFSYNEVSNLPDWPDGCPLRVIDGSYNQLTSIQPLANMNELTHVNMDYNLLTTVDPIADCYHLVMVNVYGNEIEDVSALTEHNIIVNYDPT